MPDLVSEMTSYQSMAVAILPKRYPFSSGGGAVPLEDTKRYHLLITAPRHFLSVPFTQYKSTAMYIVSAKFRSPYTDNINTLTTS